MNAIYTKSSYKRSILLLAGCLYAVILNVTAVRAVTVGDGGSNSGSASTECLIESLTTYLDYYFACAQEATDNYAQCIVDNPEVYCARIHEALIETCISVGNRIAEEVRSKCDKLQEDDG